MGKYFKRNKRLSVLMASLLAVIFLAATVYARTERNKVVYTDRQTFNKKVVHKREVVKQSTVQRFNEYTLVDLGGTSFYTIDKRNGSEFWIDDYLSTRGTRIDSGVSILFPKITPDYDNYEVKIYKATGIAAIGTSAGVTPWGTGTTPIVISTVAWESGTTDGIWNVTSGGTQESTTKIPPELLEMDATGDWLKFKAAYGVNGSTWYQVGRYIQ